MKFFIHYRRELVEGGRPIKGKHFNLEGEGV